MRSNLKQSKNWKRDSFVDPMCHLEIVKIAMQIFVIIHKGQHDLINKILVVWNVPRVSSSVSAISNRKAEILISRPRI